MTFEAIYQVFRMQLFSLTLPTTALQPIFGLLLLVSLMCVSKQARAEHDELKKLMLTNNCMACHQIDKRKYGPNFIEIGTKYGNSNSAIATLTTKIKAGGSGVWGDDMMPPQPQVSDANAKRLAELILALKSKD